MSEIKKITVRRAPNGRWRVNPNGLGLCTPHEWGTFYEAIIDACYICLPIALKYPPLPEVTR